MNCTNHSNTFPVQISNQFNQRMRKHRREEQFCYEILTTLECEFGCSTFVIGSAIEGTMIKDSDLDALWCYKYITVIDNLKDAQQGEKPVLMMIDCTNSPGYVKLQVVLNDKLLTDKGIEGELLHLLSDTYDMYRSDCDGRIVFSNIMSVNHFHEDMIKKGPAFTDKEKALTPNLSNDFVPALRYNSWPTIANEWISRTRNSEWPSKIVIDRFKKLGCFLVKVGSPGSTESDLEWRISFSLQERELMFGLNNVQHKCYVILKWIKHRFLKSDKGKFISSYHCKTCLFYMIERSPRDMWVPENLTTCVIECLNILQEFVVARNCPNYFIVNENMFERITDNELWQNVSEKLTKLINEDVKIVLAYKKYQSEHVFKNPNGSAVHLGAVYAAQLSEITNALSFSVNILRRILKLDKKPNAFVFNNDEFILETTEALKIQLGLLKSTFSVPEHTAEECKSAIDLVVPFIHTSIGSHLAALSFQCKDMPEKEKFQTLAIQHFNMGVASDLASGRLKKVTFLYKKQQYDTCFEELCFLEKLYQSYVTHISCMWHSKEATTRQFNIDLLSFLEKHDYSNKEFAQLFCSACLVFFPTEIHLMPLVLQIELFKIVKFQSKYAFICECLFIDSQIYMYFLFYLISKKLNKPRNERLLIIQKMETVLPNMYSVATAYDLIAWALEEEGFIIKALKYFVLSWNHQTTKADYLTQKSFFRYSTPNLPVNGKSSIWHALLLIWRIWFMDYISCIETSYQLSLCFRCLKQEQVIMQKCSQCKIARYCCKDCQRKDWKVHKNYCKGVKFKLQAKSD